jgi:hypothetical protein
MTNITDDVAKADYGITSHHEIMENGELRFHLRSEDGCAYIRTESGTDGAWQKSHFHKSVKETYIVQKGWMAFATYIDEELELVIAKSGDELTTEPFVIHNVYLAAGAIIHTVKHGAMQNEDWFGYVEFDKVTKNLSEEGIMRVANKSSGAKELDSRYSPYTSIYNNLDNLLWKIPSLFIGGAAILIGFVANIVSKPNTSLSHELWSIIFLLIGTLFLLGSYSMSRIRIHHSRMGNELGRLEEDGYFHTREETANRYWPLSAPIVFILVFSALGVALFFLGLISVFCFETLEPFLMQAAQP